jgi:hypothetical protein
MKEKIGFYGSALFSLLFCLLLVDLIIGLINNRPALPASHKHLLLLGFLIWFISLVAGRDHDDDLAGQL